MGSGTCNLGACLQGLVRLHCSCILAEREELTFHVQRLGRWAIAERN